MVVNGALPGREWRRRPSAICPVSCQRVRYAYQPVGRSFRRSISSCSYCRVVWGEGP
jgi:hypothetical protein